MEYLFSIPDFTNPVTKLIVFLFKECPEIFKENIVIDNCYGSFFSDRLNGGRTYKQEDVYSIEDKIKIFNYYNKFNVGIRWTFTNSLIQNSELTDSEKEYYNILLKELNINKLNSVTIYQDAINDYLKSNFQNLSTVSSITKVDYFDNNSTLEENWENYKKYLNSLESYDYIVLDYRFNDKIEWLKTLPKDILNKIEVCVDLNCSPQCRCVDEHYKTCSEYIKNNIKEKVFIDGCLSRIESSQGKQIRYSTTLDFEDLNDFVSIGINKFKFAGRGNQVSLFEKYANFFIKPEYINKVKELLNSTWSEI